MNYPDDYKDWEHEAPTNEELQAETELVDSQLQELSEKCEVCEGTGQIVDTQDYHGNTLDCPKCNNLPYDHTQLSDIEEIKKNSDKIKASYTPEELEEENQSHLRSMFTEFTEEEE